MKIEKFQQDPYTEVDALSPEDLKDKIDSLSLDQLSYLKSKTELAMKNSAFDNMEMDDNPEPIRVDGKTLAELSEIKAMVSQAMKSDKWDNVEM
jgi:hypothetical protein